MAEGKNKAEPRKGPGSIEGKSRQKLERRLRPRQWITGGNSHAGSSMRHRKTDQPKNPGAGPASVADMQAMKRSGHTVRETRKKVKNVKGRVPQKKVTPLSVYIGKQLGKLKSSMPRQLSPGTRGGMVTPKRKSRIPGRNPSKKEKR